MMLPVLGSRSGVWGLGFNIIQGLGLRGWYYQKDDVALYGTVMTT